MFFIFNSLIWNQRNKKMKRDPSKLFVSRWLYITKRFGACYIPEHHSTGAVAEMMLCSGQRDLANGWSTLELCVSKPLWFRNVVCLNNNKYQKFYQYSLTIFTQHLWIFFTPVEAVCLCRIKLVNNKCDPTIH